MLRLPLKCSGAYSGLALLFMIPWISPPTLSLPPLPYLQHLTYDSTDLQVRTYTHKTNSEQYPLRLGVSEGLRDRGPLQVLSVACMAFVYPATAVEKTARQTWSLLLLGASSRRILGTVQAGGHYVTRLCTMAFIKPE